MRSEVGRLKQLLFRTTRGKAILLAQDYDPTEPDISKKHLKSLFLIIF